MDNKSFFVQKGITATTDPSFIAQLGVRVEPEIVNMHPAKDPFRQRLMGRDRENPDRAAVYSILTEIDFDTATDPFFQEGKCPVPVTYTQIQKSKVKKSFGVQGGLTNAAIAAAMGIANAKGIDNKIQTEEEREIERLNIAYRNTLDWAMINGDSVANPLAFDGLAVEVSAANGSTVIDLSGNDLLKTDIVNLITLLGMMGVAPTLILTNPMMAQYIVELFENSNYGAEQQVDPFKFRSIPTANGRIDVMGDPHIGVTHVSASDYTTTVYVLTESHNDVELLYMDYLIPETVLPSSVFNNGADCTSINYGMYGIGTLVSRANMAQAKFINAGFNASSLLSTQIVTLSSQRI